MPLTQQASVVSVGSIHGGVRSNIIPEEVEMLGTIRALDEEDRKNIAKQVREKAQLIAQSMGATAVVELPYSSSLPVTYNDPELTAKMMPTLENVIGKDKINIVNPVTGAEDFSIFANEVPGMFFFLGGKPLDKPLSEVAPHHTADFYVDEAGMKVGVKALSQLAIDYLNSHSE